MTLTTRTMLDRPRPPDPLLMRTASPAALLSPLSLLAAALRLRPSVHVIAPPLLALVPCAPRATTLAALIMTLTMRPVRIAPILPPAMLHIRARALAIGPPLLALVPCVPRATLIMTLTMRPVRIAPILPPAMLHVRARALAIGPPLLALVPCVPRATTRAALIGPPPIAFVRLIAPLLLAWALLARTLLGARTRVLTPLITPPAMRAAPIVPLCPALTIRGPAATRIARLKPLTPPPAALTVAGTALLITPATPLPT